MSERVLVTGATGFLGQYVVRELVAHGYDVVAVSRGSRGQSSQAALPDEAVKLRADVLDRPSLDAAIGGCSAVFHCAGRVSRDPKDAEDLHALHVGGTKNVLDAAEKAGVRRVVVASTSGTSAVTSNPKAVLDETAPPALSVIASWPYYRTKLFAEQAALDRNRPGFEIVVVSPTLLFGPGDLLNSSSGDIVDLLEQRIPILPGGGLSFVDARDAAIGMVLAYERGIAGHRYLLAAQNLTLAAFAQKIERLGGTPAPRMRAPASLKLARAGAWLDKVVANRLGGQPRMDPISMEMAQYFWYVDSTKARAELGWEPRDPMDTLAETVADLFARGVVWPAA